MNKKISLAMTFVFVALYLIAMTATGFAQPDPTIMTAKTAGMGNYLVDSQGRTLYYFTKDAPGMSTTMGPVAANWPAFYAGEIMVPGNLDAADFGVITRTDGMKQTTYKGWPLYYFSKDMTAGDMKGQQVNSVWYIINVN
jgi:predicted lipoprotein with Yx(FWY)xxD motif